jgi:hypothetical protein
MRYSLPALLLVALCASAQDHKLNTLSPKEAADGWILLFDGATAMGWNIDAAGKVEDGTLVLGAKTAVTAIACPEFECQFDRRLQGGAAFLNVAGERSQQGLGVGQAKDWVTQRVRCWYENGRRRCESVDQHGRSETGASEPPGAATLSFEVRSGGRLELRNFKFRPLGAQPLFNGKDLSGWKVFPGDKYKSKFAVVDGAINVKDGPGDIQTEGKFGDFILQLECISNGMHLNSGIFFRCRPGEYQNGYEAQVRNQFTPEPTQEYTVEEYDPKTHELVAKKKVKSTAFDFGTGAIYRRMPARKQMSHDGAWFTLTLAARGNHLSTWVNGVQQVDWHDHRPISDNARTGCRLEAGHISIQGHDPTTDLSFRNIRIVELPKSSP